VLAPPREFHILPDMKYLILLLLAALSAVFTAWLGPRSRVVEALGWNLCAGFLSALAIVIFIERAIEKKRQEERERIAALALRHMRLPLQRIISFFAEMIKATVPHPFLALPRSLAELFRAANTANLDWLNFGAETGNLAHYTWATYGANVLKVETDKLSASLDKYLAVLDAEFVEAVETMCDDTFLHLVGGMHGFMTAAAGHPQIQFHINGTAGIRATFFDRLLEVVHLYQKNGGQPLQVPTSLIREDIYPHTGSGRLAALPAPIGVWAGDPPPHV
jgi:hypothetical protein